MSDAVLTERRGHTLLITLNRPEARNAVNHDLAVGIASALDELNSDEELRAGVVTGAGKGFCAGFDLKSFIAGDADPYAGDRGFAGIVRRPPEKPLVAAIEGFAFAGGMEIALSCDLIVAAEGALFAIPEVKVGLVAAAGGLLRLPRRIPHHIAMQMVLTGEPITAARAYEVGLVNELTEPGQALARALELANRVAVNAPIALRLTKAIATQAPLLPEPQAWALQDEISQPIFDTEDAREGATAFAERRSPVWNGR